MNESTSVDERAIGRESTIERKRATAFESTTD